MGEVLDRWRLNEGWTPLDKVSHQMAIRTYVFSLDREKVPADAYNELYERAIKTRAIAIQSGKPLPVFGAELLLAHWLGDNGLSKERRIAADRQLNPQCDQVCPDCFNTGKKIFGADKGKPCLHLLNESATAGISNGG